MRFIRREPEIVKVPSSMPPDGKNLFSEPALAESPDARKCGHNVGSYVKPMQEGDRLIIEPTKKKSLLKLLSTWQPSDEGLPDIDQGLLPLDR